MKRYFGNFADYQDMIGRWDGAEAVKDEEVIVASYDDEGYNGQAMMLFGRDGRLFLAECWQSSCNGLDSFDPEEITREEVGRRRWGGVDSEARERLRGIAAGEVEA